MQKTLIVGYEIPIGQNLAWNSESWNSAIMDWFNEYKNFRFGVGSFNGKRNQSLYSGERIY